MTSQKPASQKFQTRQSIEAFLEKLNESNMERGMLPFYHEVEKNKLVLSGTDNIGERDEHSICRIGDAMIAYEGAVEVRGHMAEGGIVTRGDVSNIRITGYLAGESEANPIRIHAQDGLVSLGDTNQPERRNVTFAHIEAAAGITVYKRPLIHTTLISHYEDAILRGQIMDELRVTAPYISLSTSIGRRITAVSEHDVVMKGAKFTHCDITSREGEVFISAGAIAQCKVRAKYDIEFCGYVDEYTLKNAKSEKGQVRCGGEPVNPGQRKRAQG